MATIYSIIFSLVQSVHCTILQKQLVNFFVQISDQTLGLFVGGGPIIDIVSSTMQNRDAAYQKERLEDLENKVAKLEKALCSRQFRVEADIYMACTNSHDILALRTRVKPNPEEILRIFLMKHLGLKIVDDFAMANVRSNKDLKPAELR